MDHNWFVTHINVNPDITVYHTFDKLLMLHNQDSVGVLKHFVH